MYSEVLDRFGIDMELWCIQQGQIVYQDTDTVLKVDKARSIVLEKVEHELNPLSIALAINHTRVAKIRIVRKWSTL